MSVDNDYDCAIIYWACRRCRCGQFRKGQKMSAGVGQGDRIAWVRVSSVFLPLATPISDAKVLTGRQKPMTEIAILFTEIETADGHAGVGFSYSKRAGGPGQFAPPDGPVRGKAWICAILSRPTRITAKS